MDRRLWMTALVCVAVALGGCAGRSQHARQPAASTAAAPPAVPPPPGDPAAALGLTRRLPAEYVKACAALRRRVQVNPCPPLVPDGPIGISGPGREDIGLDLASSSLASINGRFVETNNGHWTISVATDRAGRKLLAYRLQMVGAGGGPGCRLLELDRQPVRACRVPPYSEGGGYYGGHIAYAWRRGGVVYHLTIHGYANEPRLRLMMAALIAQETGGSAAPAPVERPPGSAARPDGRLPAVR